MNSAYREKELQGQLEKDSAVISIKRNMAWNSIGSLFYLVCNWLTTVFVVTFSQDFQASGTLTVAMSVGNVFAAIMLYKARTIQVSDIENKFSAGHFVAHRLITFLLACIICIVYSQFTVSGEDTIPVYAFLLFKAVECFIDAFHGVDQRFDKFSYIGISQIMRGAMIVVAFLVGICLFADLLIAINLMTLASLVICAIYDIPKSNRLASLRPIFNLKIIKQIFVMCTPGFIAYLLCTTLVSVVRQAYGLEYGNELLGIYAALSTPAVIMQALASFIYAPLIKPIAEAWIEGKISVIKNIVRNFFIAMVIILFACMTLYFLCGEQVLSFIYRKDISTYSYLMYPLLICTGTIAIALFLIDIFMIFAEYKGALVANILSIALALLIMHSMFQGFGSNGISLTIILALSVNIFVSLLFFASKMKKRQQLVGQG